MKEPGFSFRSPRLVLWSAALAALGMTFALSAFAVAATQTTGETRDNPEKDLTRAFIWKSAGGGYLGVQVLGLTPELRRHFGVPEDAGVLIARVEEKGPAAAAGLQVGDILTQVEGKPVSDPVGLARAVRQKKAGELVPVDLYRDGSLLSMTVSVEERERPVIDLAGMRVLPEAGMPDFEAPLEGDPAHGFVFAGPGLDEESVKAFEQAMRGIED